METIAICPSACSNPPLHQTYRTLFETSHQCLSDAYSAEAAGAAKSELPVIDLGPLIQGGSLDEVEKCKRKIAEASAEWGFFQVVNHGVPSEIIKSMRKELEGLFNRPFEEKKSCVEISGSSYRWGTPSATSISQVSWHEAFHIPLSHFVTSTNSRRNSNFRCKEQYVGKVKQVAARLTEALAEEAGRDNSTSFMEQNYCPNASFLRLNKYPPCPLSSDIYGLMPHTDSNFLTILYQDEVGGLQVKKDGKWISVQPNPEALVVNIGDLFQVWSNDMYKSVEHRVVASHRVERHSAAYFLCPPYETVIEGSGETQAYRKFTYGDYRDQVAEDVVKYGYKVGLSRFRKS